LLAPHLILLSLLSFLIKPYVSRSVPWIKKSLTYKKPPTGADYDHDHAYAVTNIARTESSLTRQFTFLREKASQAFQSESRTLLLVCLFAILPSILLVIYPYAVIKEPSALLGTDIPVYLEWMNLLSLASHNSSVFLYQLFIGIFDGDRPFSLLTIYSISAISGQSYETILKFLPALLGPPLVMSAYFLIRTAYSEDRRVALIVAIMTAASHQLVIGFYAAFYANWMALIFMFVSTLFLIKSLRGSSPVFRNIVLFAVCTTLTLFFHSYTWSYFISVVVLFLIWSAVVKKKSRQNLKVIIILGTITFGIIMIDATKSYFVGSTTGFQKDLDLAESKLSVNEFKKRWSNLDATFKIYVGGFLANSPILLLLLIWVLKADYSNTFDRFFLSALFVALLPILFGDFVVQSRIFYIIPLQIPASIMMYKIYKSPDVIFGIPLLFALILMQFNYVIRGMANMNFVPPGG